jgi:hypothetical protein
MRMSPAVEHKLVSVRLNDRDGFEKAITAAGKDGWEFCGSERFEKLEWNSGTGVTTTGEIVLVFKRTAGGTAVSGMMGPGGMGAGSSGGRGGRGGGGAGGTPGRGTPGDPAADPLSPPAAKPPLTVIKIRNAAAADLVVVVNNLFPSVDLTAEPRTNQLIFRADPQTLREIEELLLQLDVEDAARPPALRKP